MKRNIIYMVGALLSSAILTLSCAEDNVPSYSGLVVNKNDLFIKIEDHSATINITEGNGNYKVEVADENIATAKVEGDKVIFTAVKNGRTTATITDWAKHSTKVNIRVKEDFNLELDKEEITLINVEGKKSQQIYITSGNDEYKVESSDENIVTAVMNTDGTVQITYVSGGRANVIVTDADGKEAILKVASCDYDLTLDVIPMAVKTTLNKAIKIATGNGKYEVSSNNESIAIAELVVDEQNSDIYSIKITGVASGNTEITITDKMGLSYTFPIKIRDGLSIETTSINNLEIGIPQIITINDGSGDYTWSASNSTMTCSFSDDKTQLIVNGAKSSINQTITFTDKTFNESKTINVEFIDYPFDVYGTARSYIAGNFFLQNASEFTTKGANPCLKVGEWYKPIFGSGYYRNGYALYFGNGFEIGKKGNGTLSKLNNSGKEENKINVTDVEIVKTDVITGEGKGKFWIKFREPNKEKYSYIITWT